MSSQDVTIAIAVGDSALRAEVLAAAAATSVHVTTVEDPRDFPRHLPKASVVIADKLTAALVAKHSVAPVFFVVADPGPIDYEAAMKCRSAEAFIVPAESKQLLSALADQVSPREQSGGSFALAVVGAAGEWAHLPLPMRSRWRREQGCSSTPLLTPVGSIFSLASRRNQGQGGRILQREVAP